MGQYARTGDTPLKDGYTSYSIDREINLMGKNWDQCELIFWRWVF